ncbi:hypothetical protein [Halogeometricum luteum]|uniref:Yip1 domain-containing protein n=1 Tax=Halogeometricum luteum TaxID=2950537 RepID=A0ABU2FZ65_9EURY|nr:hypothetical protein [Halogeometricum sp. S3BR5-2]MDS0293810.1 hypothetical protein [Halogeometricum sp. S3BR5-2]
MESAGFLTALGTTCKRYGPGRLPRADRRDVGAGYALASAATGATLLFAAVSWGMHGIGSPVGSDWEFLGTMSLLALPLVVPTSFAAAVLVWRALPADVPHFGAVAGLLSTVGTYLLALGALFAFYAAVVVLEGRFDQILEAVGFVALIGFVAVATTCWLTIPVGIVSGVVHERVTR